MNRVEVTEALGRIKSHYPYFTVENYVVTEWLRFLKPYDNYDVNQKLDAYFQDDSKERPPTVKYLMKYLQTPGQKATNSNNFRIDCQLCHKFMTLDEYNNHYSKCLSINYLLMIFKNKDMNVSREELENLDEKTFRGVYEKYKEY